MWKKINLESDQRKDLFMVISLASIEKLKLKIMKIIVILLELRTLNVMQIKRLIFYALKKCAFREKIGQNLLMSSVSI